MPKNAKPLSNSEKAELREQRRKRGRRSKRKGSRQELRTRHFLENLGYNCTKSSASLGLFDIIAISRKEVKLSQVKSNRMPPREEMEALKEFAEDSCPDVCTIEIWIWKDRVRLPIVKIL